MKALSWEIKEMIYREYKSEDITVDELAKKYKISIGSVHKIKNAKVSPGTLVYIQKFGLDEDYQKRNAWIQEQINPPGKVR